MATETPRPEPITLHDIDRQMLVGAYAELRNWAGKNPDDFTWGEWRDRARHRQAKERRSVDCEIATWLGRKPSGAERRSASRGLQRLHAAGLVIRLSYDSSPNRTSGIQFTPEGEKLAAKLSAEAK